MTDVLTPHSAAPRLSAARAIADNLAALETLTALEQSGAPASSAERTVLERWHGWGAAAGFFEDDAYTAERERVRELLGVEGYDAARRTVLNAHYTGPTLIEAMWSVLPFLGVEGGLFLEPGCGRGTFLDAAPPSFAGLGVELDPTTARIAALLVDSRHVVHAGDFGAVTLERDRAVAALGNVPFGNYAVFDAIYNPALRLSIHDHFLLKSVAALAPGGVAMLITSRYSLDKASDYARHLIGGVADFLGAVRLRSGAHAAAAGAEVVSDVLVLRRRDAGEEPKHAPGFLEPTVEIEDGVHVSAYFATHGGAVLGTPVVRNGRFGADLFVEGDASNDAGLAGALMNVAAFGGRRRPFPRSADGPEGLLAADSVFEAPVGRIESIAGGFRRFTGTTWEIYDPKGAAAELSQLCVLRDLTRSLVALEATAPDGDIDTEIRRAELAQEYEAYVNRFGPLNRFAVSEKTGRRTYPRLGGFRADPDWPRLAALEIFDEETHTATPATILSRRVVSPHVPAAHVDDPAEAIAVSLAECGRLDRLLIAHLLGCAPEEVSARLGAFAFEDPRGDLVDAATYLSGNVREKLAAARVALEEEGEHFARNVAALEEVIPLDLQPEDLERVLGAPWIEPALIQEFAHTLLGPNASDYDRSAVKVTYVQSAGEWVVDANKWTEQRLTIGHEFGTNRMSALRIFHCALNGRSPVVTVPDDNGHDVVLPDETQAAIEKANLLIEAFDDWLLREDPERSAAAMRVYNDRFNSHVPRDFSGYRVAAPGLSSDFVLRDLQHEGIARILATGNTALWWEVGTGKTATMVVAGMEMKRLGMIRRPLYVVPNNLLQQFATDICRLYPHAEVLVVDKDDVSPKNRALFAARVRSHDWDAVVITHSSFTRWSVSPEIEERYCEQLIFELRTELEAAAVDTGTKATRLMERRLASAESRLASMRYALDARQDENPFPFDESGIDFLFVDEADEFKNVEIHSSVRALRGVPVGKGSQRALDLGLKLWHLAGECPERQSVFATGTPISNTVAELWAFARYQRPDLLRELGVYAFDDFRRQFADAVSAMELDLTRSYRRVERLARYKAVPELVRMLHEFADIRSADDAGLPRPEVAGGKRQVVLVETSPQLEEFITDELARRVEAVHNGEVEPEEDNMLKLSTEARLASFDWEAFRHERVEDRYSIIAAAADNVAHLYHENATRTYLQSDGTPHARPGALQLVFCDLSTPKPDRKDTAYDRLRDRLVTLGVPRERIVFAHEHDKDDEARARLQEMCRDGRVGVVVSSTAKFGVGTNVQQRCVAIHHLDCPWRPRDIEQREGRGVRQGNQNATVAIFAYVVERSYGVYGWQTLERKAGFIGQILRAVPEGPRYLVADDDEALSYGEVKAIATGDPDFLRVAEIEEQVARLQRLARSHSREQAAIQRRAEQFERMADEALARIEALTGLARDVGRAGGAAAFLWRRRWSTLAAEADPLEIARTIAHAAAWTPTSVELLVGERVLQIAVNRDYAGGKLVDEAVLRVGSLRLARRIGSRDNVSSVVQALRNLAEDVAKASERLSTEEATVTGSRREAERLRTLLGGQFARADELAERTGELLALRHTLEERYAKEEDKQAA